jgi:nicotinamidase/pyrazinamidase
VFRKGTDPAIDSYSGFFDNGHKKATGMGDWLRARGIGDVVVLGLATDYCVKFTALDARGLGMTVTLVADGCRAVDLAPGDGERAIDEMRRVGVSIRTLAEMSAVL